MVCDKCGYRDRKEIRKGPYKFCRICSVFSPNEPKQLREYVSEKAPWKALETFRKFGILPGAKQKEGMAQKAREGFIVTRPPKGYDLVRGKLRKNKESLAVYRLFNNFLKEKGSLNSFSKKNNLSLNATKKILTNRTYLGEIKFNKVNYKSNHEPIVDSELFYAVQRKINERKTI